MSFNMSSFNFIFTTFYPIDTPTNAPTAPKNIPTGPPATTAIAPAITAMDAPFFQETLNISGPKYAQPLFNKLTFNYIYLSPKKLSSL